MSTTLNEIELLNHYNRVGLGDVLCLNDRHSDKMSLGQMSRSAIWPSVKSTHSVIKNFLIELFFVFSSLPDF